MDPPGNQSRPLTGDVQELVMDGKIERFGKAPPSLEKAISPRMTLRGLLKKTLSVKTLEEFEALVPTSAEEATPGADKTLPYE